MSEIVIGRLLKGARIVKLVKVVQVSPKSPSKSDFIRIC
jgi:hypothetical protein